MSAKIENWQDIRELVKMSVGTDKGRWRADPAFGSELWLLRQNGKVDGQTADALRRMVIESVQWLVKDGLVKNIDCDAERTGKNEITYTVTTVRPDGTPDMLVKEAWSAV
jgi:phage gp46-like protein